MARLQNPFRICLPRARKSQKSGATRCWLPKTNMLRLVNRKSHKIVLFESHTSRSKLLRKITWNLFTYFIALHNISFYWREILKSTNLHSSHQDESLGLVLSTRRIHWWLLHLNFFFPSTTCKSHMNPLCLVFTLHS